MSSIRSVLWPTGTLVIRRIRYQEGEPVMVIRKLEMGDITAACTISELNYGAGSGSWINPRLVSMFTSGINRPEYHAVLENGTLVGFGGFAQSLFDDSVYQIFSVNVTPTYQGQGIGQKVVGSLLAAIRRTGDAKLVVLSANETDGMVGFYRTKFGFRSVVDEVGGYTLMVLRVAG